MGLKGLREFFSRHRRIAFDTTVFIYHLEATPEYGDLAGTAFEWLEKRSHSAVTSTLTMTELLVKPYRDGNQPQVDQYFALLSQFPNLEWVGPDLEIADRAARIRALYRLRTPDAIQIATGICRGATAILTNNSAIARVAGMEVRVLSKT